MKSVEMDFDGARWYAEAYSKAYDKLTGSIKNYMISTQSSLAPRTEQLKRNAYRAVTPVLISLLVMIAIVLMLYYFVSAYLVRPVLAMNKSLGDYLRFGLPFRIKAEVKDEVAELEGSYRRRDPAGQENETGTMMRLGVVLRYVGIIMLVVALFMLLSAGVSLVSHTDSGYYPLLLSALLTALLGAFPLIFVDRTEQLSSKEGYCIVVGSWIVASVVGMFPLPDVGRRVLARQRLVRERVGLYDHRCVDPERRRGAAARAALLAVVFDVAGRCRRGDVRAADSSFAGDEQGAADQRRVVVDGQAYNYHYKASMIAQILLFIYLGLTFCSTLALKLAGHELVRRADAGHVGRRNERIQHEERQHRVFRQRGRGIDPDRDDVAGQYPFRRAFRYIDGTPEQYFPFGGDAVVSFDRGRRDGRRGRQPLFRRGVRHRCGGRCAMRLFRSCR